uniref:Uncharacterized protein n=1 Tax=Romanomermis culicivorax TaxID=13658 RepID=A0A915ILR8_ROMCU
MRKQNKNERITRQMQQMCSEMEPKESKRQKKARQIIKIKIEKNQESKRNIEPNLEEKVDRMTREIEELRDVVKNLRRIEL